MHKILICSDKYKGSLTSAEVNNAIHRGIITANYPALCDLVSVSDGGDGFLTSIPGLELVEFPAENALAKPITVVVGYKDSVIYIEVSTVIGLAMLGTDSGRVLNRSSYGLGKLIYDILNTQKSINKIIIGCGGSSTNDAGFGCLIGLGAKFMDAQYNILPPNIDSIQSIAKIDLTTLHPKLKSISIEIIADVTGDLLGSNGCTLQFARQKGASADEITQLEQCVTKFQQLLLTQTNIDIAKCGYGICCGGLPAGLSILPNIQYFAGSDWVIRQTNLEAKIAYCDLVFSGEGMVDNTTMHGKLVASIAKLCHKHQKPLIIIAGQINCEVTALNELGVTAAFPIINKLMATDNNFANSDKLITQRVKSLVQLVKAF